MRKIALIVAVLVAVLSVADYQSWRTSNRRLTALATESGLSQRRPEVGIELARQTVATRASTFLAWNLLALEVDRSWIDELPSAERAAELRRGLHRLRLAGRLAREVLPARPSSWQAATVLGVSRYLEAHRQRTERLPATAWREPLGAAMRLAPGHPEPSLFLASAYFSRWSSLSGAERDELPAVLARALRHPRGLQLLLPIWVRIAPSLEELLQPIPDRPEAWQRLGEEFLRREDVERYCVARQRWLAVMPQELERRVDLARARLAGNARGWAVDILRSVAAAPTRVAHAESFAAAVAAMPPDIDDVRWREHLHRWLSWTLALCPVSGCPLDEDTVAELQRRLPGLPELDAAAARASLGRASADSWPAGAWSGTGSLYRLEVRPDQAAEGLRIGFRSLPAAGSAIELLWDGRVGGVFFVAPDEELLWRSPVEQGPHLLEIRDPSGSRFAPAAVSLLPAPGG